MTIGNKLYAVCPFCHFKHIIDPAISEKKQMENPWSQDPKNPANIARKGRTTEWNYEGCMISEYGVRQAFNGEVIASPQDGYKGDKDA